MRHQAWPALATTLAFGVSACNAPAGDADQGSPRSAERPAAVTASGPAKIGATLFLQCRACHTIGDGDANGIGPNLHNVFGAKAASHAGYDYSKGLKSSGMIWSRANLDAFLQAPSAKVPGTKMTFQGIVDDKQRAAVIDYLASVQTERP